MRFGLWFGPDSSDEAANWERDADCLLDLHRRLGIDYFKMDSMKLNSSLALKRNRMMFDKMLREALAVIIEENGRTATGEEELRVLFKRAFTSYLPEAFSAATELLSEQNDEMAEAVVDEAIVTLVQDQIRRNRT